MNYPCPSTCGRGNLVYHKGTVPLYIFNKFFQKPLSIARICIIL